MTRARSLYERLWEDHLVLERPGEPALLYIDMHLVHEVTSPQAFDGLRRRGRGRGLHDRRFGQADIGDGAFRRIARNGGIIADGG